MKVVILGILCLIVSCENNPTNSNDCQNPQIFAVKIDSVFQINTWQPVVVVCNRYTEYVKVNAYTLFDTAWIFQGTLDWYLVDSISMDTTQLQYSISTGIPSYNRLETFAKNDCNEFIDTNITYFRTDEILEMKQVLQKKTTWIDVVKGISILIAIPFAIMIFLDRSR